MKGVDINMKLWYESQAKEWVQALPMGNGHMGAMAFGGTTGKFELSENTCWAGAPQDKYIDEKAKEYMSKARNLIMDKKIDEAEELLSKCCGIKENFGTQLPMGRVYVGVNASCLKQSRELDLMTGVNKDKLFFEDCTIKRESFMSNPAKVMCIKMSSDSDRLPQLRVWAEGWSNPSKTIHNKGEEILVKGRALENIHSDGLHGVEYTIKLKLVTDGVISCSRKELLIDNASTLIVYLTSATNMFFENIDEHCEKLLNSAKNLSWEKLFAQHCEEHISWMGKCKFNLPKNQWSDLPTNKRLENYKKDNTDYDLVTLFFQYGRYLLLSSSRPDSLLPAALQGLWNDDRACQMEWTDDIHLDINTQMNYYPAEVTGLSECTMPLFKWLKNILMPNGRKIAKDLYDGDGWVAHTTSNAYGWAAPGWAHNWGFNVSAGGWIALHIWEHYLYTKDSIFLKEYFNVIYDAGRFLFSILTQDYETNELVINPSYSPENSFIYKGKQHHIATGSTIDMSVTKCIFKAIINGAEILGCEDAWTNELRDTITKLPNFKIGKHGQLQEWYEDYEEAKPDHRHTSHLLSLHPFNLINPQTSSDLKEAIKTSLNRRLGKNAEDIVLANWAGALLIMYYARLLEGEEAAKFIEPMICFLSRENLMITHEGPTTSITGGIYELDGNTGFTAAIAEMLLQSYTGEINILPAIPAEWSVGECQGLCCYDGHKVGIEWNKQQIKVVIHANLDTNIIIKYDDQKKEIKTEKGKEYHVTFLKK